MELVKLEDVAVDAAHADQPPPLSAELAAAVAAIEQPAGEQPAGDNAAPGDAGPAPAAAGSAMTIEEAARLARLGVDWVSDALVKQYPALVDPPAVGLADEATRARAAELAGAVIAKRNLPAFLDRWKEEFLLGVFLAGVAWASYQRVQAGRAPKSDGGAAPPA